MLPSWYGERVELQRIRELLICSRTLTKPAFYSQFDVTVLCQLSFNAAAEHFAAKDQLLQPFLFNYTLVIPYCEQCFSAAWTTGSAFCEHMHQRVKSCYYWPSAGEGSGPWRWGSLSHQSGASPREHLSARFIEPFFAWPFSSITSFSSAAMQKML